MENQNPPLSGQDSAIKATDEEAHAALQQQRAHRCGLMAAFLQQAGNRFRNCTLDAFVPKCDKRRAALEACRAYIDDLPSRLADGQGVVFIGPTGCGKSHLAFAIAGAAIMRWGRNARWQNAIEWFPALRDTIAAKESERRAIDQLTGCPLLILDDLIPFGSSLTPYQIQAIYQLLNDRWIHGRPTIATMNVDTIEEADSKLSPPVWDRLADQSLIIRCAWPSWRSPRMIVNSL